MTTSGTTTFTVTRDEIIAAALRLCGVLQDGQAVSTQQTTDAAQALNILLKNFSIKGWIQHLYLWVNIPLVSGQASYTLGASGAGTPLDRPMRIARGFIRNTNGYDTPMIQLTRQEYDVTTPKDIPGIPNSFYYDALVGVTSTTVGAGKLYTWPVINDTGYEMYVTVERQIQDITNSTQQFDLPQEWFLPLKWQLAAEIGPEYGVTERTQQRIDQKAAMYLEDVANFATAEEPSVYFSPSSQLGA